MDTTTLLLVHIEKRRRLNLHRDPTLTMEMSCDIVSIVLDSKDEREAYRKINAYLQGLPLDLA